MEKETLIYETGCLLWLPVAFGLCTDSCLVVGASLFWGVFLWNSPKVSKTAKRFWRAWHKFNFKILSTI